MKTSFSPDFEGAETVRSPETVASARPLTLGSVEPSVAVSVGIKRSRRPGAVEEI
jgi:hypothetical protein